MECLIRVPKCISERIRTSKDLSDYYAYEERWGDEISYQFDESEQERIDELVYDINYEQGVYDIENVNRIVKGEER